MSAVYMPKKLFGMDGTLQGVDVPRKALQKIHGEMLSTDRDFYQNFFGVYNFLPLGDHLEARMLGLRVKPMLWQSRNLTDCCYDVLGGTETTRTNIQTSPLVMALEQCPDELFGGCFEAEIDPETGDQREGEGSLLAEGVKAVVSMQVESLIGNLTVGNLFDWDEIGTPEGVSSKDLADAKKVLTSTTGWLAALSAAGVDCSVLTDVFGDSLPDGCADGDALEAIFDKMICNCSKKMRNVLHRNKPGIQPIFIVDPATFGDIGAYVRSCKQNCVIVDGSELKVGGCFTQEMVQWQGRSYPVYYYQNIPIIPEDAICLFEDYTGTNVRSVTLTLAGNIGFASRVDRLPYAPGDMGLRIQRHPELHCNTLQMLSQIRIGAGIADLDYVCSSTTYETNK